MVLQKNNHLKKTVVGLIFMLLIVTISLPLTAQQIKDLMDLPLEELMKIKVTVASKKIKSINNAPGIITVISNQEIKGFAALNLGQILNRIVGASFLTANVFSDNLVQFRGQSLTPYNNHTLILLNGRPIRDPISGGLNSPVFTAFPVNTIDHIEIIRGPGSVLYGSCAYSGVINIITKTLTDNSKKINLSVGAGSNETFSQNVDFSFKKGNFSAMLGISHLDDEGPFYEFTGYEGIKGSANFDRKTLGFAVNIKYKDFCVNGYYGRFYPYALSGAHNTWSNKDPHSCVNQETFFADIGYAHNVGEKITLNANFTYNKHYIDQECGSSMNGQDYLFELSANIRPNEKSNIVIGGIKEQDDYYGENFYDDKTFIYSFYAQADYKFFEKIKLIGGVQYNKIENIKGNLSPRAGVITNFSKNFSMKILYSQAFRKAYPLETSFNHPLFKGNLEIKPELINTTEVQLYYQTKKLLSSITVFNSNMSDIISRKWHINSSAPQGKYLKYYNAGTHDYYGIELEEKYNVSKKLLFVGSYSYQMNKNENGVKNAALHPNTMVKFGILYHTPKINIGLFNSYFGEPTQVSILNPGFDDSNPAPKAYNLLSLKISCKIMDDVSISLQGDNLLDKDIRYPEYTGRVVNSLIPLYAGKILWGTIFISR